MQRSRRTGRFWWRWRNRPNSCVAMATSSMPMSSTTDWNARGSSEPSGSPSRRRRRRVAFGCFSIGSDATDLTIETGWPACERLDRMLAYCLEDPPKRAKWEGKHDPEIWIGGRDCRHGVRNSCRCFGGGEEIRAGCQRHRDKTRSDGSLQRTGLRLLKLRPLDGRLFPDDQRRWRNQWPEDQSDLARQRFQSAKGDRTDQKAGRR